MSRADAPTLRKDETGYRARYCAHMPSCAVAVLRPLSSARLGVWVKRRIFFPLSMLFATMSLLCAARASEADNKVGLWFEGQFANAHALGSIIDSRMYQIEARYTRLVYTNRSLELYYLAEVIPISLVGDSPANHHRVYAYGAGGSPVGIQISLLHHRRVQPFFTSGGGFLYFNRRLFRQTQLNFTAQLGAGVHLFTSNRHSVDFGYMYHHVSNANLGNRNPGMDSHVVFVGVSFIL